MLGTTVQTVCFIEQVHTAMTTILVENITSIEYMGGEHFRPTSSPEIQWKKHSIAYLSDRARLFEVTKIMITKFSFFFKY